MPDKIDSYRDLIVWQRALDLAVHTYELTRHWPKEELYGLTSQARRGATSVAANIAEGYGRENAGSYQQLLRIAQGSLKELETHFLIALRVGIAPQASVEVVLTLCESVGKLLRLLMRKLSSN